jgi:hypothetical protein
MGHCICDINSCPSGCCQNADCFDGQQDSQCGRNGQMCAECTGGNVCLFGICR